MMFTGVKRYRLTIAVAVAFFGAGLSWSSIAQACMVTTTVSKPTSFTATVNEDGILLRWDAPPEADKVFIYDFFRGTGQGATPTRYGTVDVETAYDENSGTVGPIGSAFTSVVDYEDMLTVGETYVYAITFGRLDNCGYRQSGIQSDTATVTYQPVH